MSAEFRILYAEDNPFDADLTRSHFVEREPDFDLEIAETGQACLDRLAATKFDLLLLDHHLPDMEGLEVLRAVLRGGISIPVVLVTGIGDEQLVVKALRSGASNYVPKLGNYLETMGELLRQVIQEHRIKQEQGLLPNAPRRILYVEHNEMDIELSTRHFDEALPRVELEVARSCAEALARLERDRGYDAVLIDLRMPDQSGLDFVREVKRRGLELPPFIMISGKGDEAAAIASLKLGAADYLPKHPGYLEQLTSTIDRAVAYDRLDRLNARLQAELGERKRVEAALTGKTLFLDTLLNAMPVPVFSTDREGRYVRVNTAFEEFFGKTREELAGKDVTEITPHDLADIYGPESRELLRSASVQVHEARLCDSQGQVHDVVCRKAAYVGADGQVAGMIGVIVDVTEERKLQASAAQSDRLASMGLLAAGVAHEMNNPLSYVLYNLESLSEDLPRLLEGLTQVRTALCERLDEAELHELLGSNVVALDPIAHADVQERFEYAREGTRRLREIARGLGAFSRAEQDSVAPVDLRYAIESAVNIAFNEVKYRARIVTELRDTAPVLASDGRMSQVFLNLLVNAAHAIPEGDFEHNSIAIRTWQDGEHVVVQVEDTGCGIPPQNLERVFDPFFTTKPVGIGSGLGLHIARNIVAAHGGTITVKSEVGAGTCFSIRLPAAKSDVKPPGPPPPGALETGRRGRVLVIDDEPGVRGVLKRILRGHEVVEVGSGALARELLAQDQRFDVILCDMMMPKVSGMDVHRWLLGNYPELAQRVVFVTGGAFTPNAAEYLKKVQNPRVEKPFDATRLQQIVTECVATSRGDGA